MKCSSEELALHHMSCAWPQALASVLLSTSWASSLAHWISAMTRASCPAHLRTSGSVPHTQTGAGLVDQHPTSAGLVGVCGRRSRNALQGCGALPSYDHIFTGRYFPAARLCHIVPRSGGSPLHVTLHTAVNSVNTMQPMPSARSFWVHLGGFPSGQCIGKLAHRR